MLAELHNKISTNSNNLERSEDQLTGDFFGTLRYLPFEMAMKTILSKVRFKKEEIFQDWETILRQEKGYMTGMEFWFRHEVEGDIDLLVSLSSIKLGIEVKYLSRLSSEDEIPADVIDYEESANQLARYSRMIADISKEKTSYLILLAPFKLMREVEQSLLNRSIIAPGVNLGFLSWEDVLDSLEELDISLMELGQQMIVEDLIKLLIKRDFLRYKGISKEILVKNVTQEFYMFNKVKNKTNTLNWPDNQLSEGDFYVFSNQ
ncbi:hypothetical protein V7182_24610 [Neobacillus drentensis]|uniref:hypothetical protein n=1 Tax=Neobacillus drentensis TaxID=220684 RepID=UPI003000F9EC